MDDIFDKFKDSLLSVDPVYWCEKNLSIDGKPFRLTDSGYKPLVDIFRYIGVKALDRDSKPVVWVKGRQVAGTTTAAALSMFFMGSGQFGNDENPPMRIIHGWPTLDRAAAYSKTKLASMIDSSVMVPAANGKKGTKPLMRNLLDTSSTANDNVQFKQFVGGNHLWIESLGLDGNRLRGKQLCLDTDLPTPSGFIKLSDVQEGQELFDENGNICHVTKIYPINFTPEAYRITFDDATTVDACADHLWLTYTKEQNKMRLPKDEGKVRSTKEILLTIEKNHFVILNKSIITIGKVSQIIDGGIRFIKDISAIPSKPMRCITVDSPSHLFLITKNFIPTHNSGDIIFIDECFPFGTRIETFRGIYKIGKLYKLFSQQKKLPQVKTFNEESGEFEYKNIVRAFKRGKRDLIQFSLGELRIKCTPNHKFLTVNKQWVYAANLSIGSEIMTSGLDATSTNLKIDKIEILNRQEVVYDIEVEDNHNFIVVPSTKTKNYFGVVVSNCQEIPAAAISNTTKVLTKSQYGALGEGVQVYFGTPLQRGSEYWKLWQQSSQQYYYLGCEGCQKHFPLYTPGSNEWESIWIHTQVVKCTHCGCEQDRPKAIDRGKWVATKNADEAKFVGFHLNQLYLPEFTKEKIIESKPENSAINTERAYQNEVLGEFFHGEAGVMSPEDIRSVCGDPERKFRKEVAAGEEVITFLGVDIGAKNDLEQLANSDRVKAQGQSFSTAVVVSVSGPGRLSIEYAIKFKRNDLQSKKGMLDEIIKRYRCKLTVCDLGYAHDFNEIMQTEYGDKFLASQVAGRLTSKVKYDSDIFPRVITFEKDFWITEMYEQMRKGLVRFPLGSYEMIAWLMQHCSNMEIKPTISRTGDVSPHYVKAGPNDGFMALLNAYIAYKFYISKGFEIKNPMLQNDFGLQKKKASVISVFSPRKQL